MPRSSVSLLFGVYCIINLLAYADDLVVIAPSWRALQFLLSIIHSQVKALDI